MLQLSFSPFPVLTTSRLILKEIIPGDCNDIFTMRADKRIMQYIDRPLAKTVDDAKVLIQKITMSLASDEGITWGIFLKENPNLIGTIGYWRIDKENHRAEIGYMLHYDFQGKGLMQEAISTVIEFGFNNMKIHSIEANVNPSNSRSIKLLEKNNFIKEAYFKENYFSEGKFLDSAIYSLLRHSD